MKFFAGALLFLMLAPATRFQLAADLKRDYALSNQHCVYIEQSDKKEIHRLDKYTRMDLSKFTFNQIHAGKHLISKWSSKSTGITMWQIQTTLNVDTIYQDQIMRIDSSQMRPIQVAEKYYVKGIFKFFTYVVDDKRNSRLIYQTEKNEGICLVMIGKRKISIMREDVRMGQPTVNLGEVLALIR